MIASNARFGPIPLLLLLLRLPGSSTAGVGPTYLHKRGHSILYCCCKGSAGTVLRSQGSLGEDRVFALCARAGLIASSARFGPIPLLLPLREVSGAQSVQRDVG